MKRAPTITAAVLLLVAMIGMVARADSEYVLALHWPPKQCFPCARMLPVESGLHTEGYDIRTIDIKAHPEFASAPGNGVPRYVYVVERGGKAYYTGAVILGECPAGQLRRFCAVPAVVTVTAATRNAIKALISPRWMFAPYHPQPLPGPVQ